jgi:hypothetical protein
MDVTADGWRYQALNEAALRQKNPRTGLINACAAVFADNIFQQTESHASRQFMNVLRIVPMAATILFCAMPNQSQARKMVVLSYQEMLEKSDLVVIAAPKSKTTETKEQAPADENDGARRKVVRLASVCGSAAEDDHLALASGALFGKVVATSSALSCHARLGSGRDALLSLGRL